MNVEIFFPVVDTTSLNFDYKGNEAQSLERPEKQENKVNVVADCETFEEIEATVNDYNGKIVDENYFQNFADNGKMTMLVISVNPNSENYNVLSEIRYWVGDSNLITNDEKLDNKYKMSVLPSRILKIKTCEDKMYKLNNCKILQEISDKFEPIKIITIVEKIENI